MNKSAFVSGLSLSMALAHAVAAAESPRRIDLHDFLQTDASINFLTPGTLEKIWHTQEAERIRTEIATPENIAAQGAVRRTKLEGDVAMFKAGLGSKGFGWMKTAIDSQKTAAELFDAYQALTREDRRMEPDYSPAGMPQIPARCAPPPAKTHAEATAGGACGACFQEAYRQLSAVRAAFEKLRRLNIATQTFTTKSLAFGDSVSAIHGVAGLAWQTQRRGIEQSLANFNMQYDKKYDELVIILRKDLQRVGDCERRYFNEPDWYSAAGSMYYAFMVDRYRR